MSKKGENTIGKGGFSGGYGRGGGFGGGGGINMNMLKQAQKMQEDMRKAQSDVEAQEFSASAGGGMVTAYVNGKRELLRLEIDSDAVIDATSAEDAEMLSDTVVAAVNEALRKAESAMESNMSKITGSLGIGF